MTKDDYELIDSGDGRKLERFGRFVLARPCSQAMWRTNLSSDAWRRADASFDREDGNRWHGRNSLPKEWEITTAGVKFRLGGTDFGHLGIFPEQRAQWQWIRSKVEEACKIRGKAPAVLNLFAYSGGSTMAAALGGAEV
jgi:23S rRNA (cytosine1962-C5)-methyltransferase